MSPKPNESVEVKDIPKQKLDSPREKSVTETAAEKLSKDYAKALRQLTEADAEFKACESRADMALLLPEKRAARTVAIDKLVDLLPPEFAWGKNLGVPTTKWDANNRLVNVPHPDDRQLAFFADHLVITGSGLADVRGDYFAIDIQFNPSDKETPVKVRQAGAVEAESAMRLSTDLLPLFSHNSDYALTPETQDGSCRVYSKRMRRNVAISSLADENDKITYFIEGVPFCEGLGDVLPKGVDAIFQILNHSKALVRPEIELKGKPFFVENGKLYFAREHGFDPSFTEDLDALGLQDYAPSLATILNKIWSGGFQQTVIDSVRATRAQAK